MEDILQFYDNHHAAILATLWFVLTLLFNLLTRFKTPEQWVEFGGKYPRLQNIIRLIRALGIDPVKAIKALGSIIRNQSNDTHKDRPRLLQEKDGDK